MSSTEPTGYLARSLWYRLSLLYLLLSVCLTGALGYDIYTSEKVRVEENMRDLAARMAPPVATALWQMNKSQAESLLSGLIKQGTIVGAQVVDEYIDQFVRIGEFPSEQKGDMRTNAYKGELKPDDDTGDISESGSWMVCWVNLNQITENNSVKNIGYLQLVSSNASVVERAKPALMTLLFAALLQAIVFITFLYAILQKKIHTPLQKLIATLPTAQQIQRQPLIESKTLLERDDEIGVLYRRISDYQQATNNELQQIEIIHDINTRDLRHTAESRATFLGNLSHGIRGQMNGVMGMAELLRETSLSNTQRTYLNALHQSGNALLETLGNMLDLAQIESGSIFIEQTAFHVHTLIRECIAAREPYAASKQLALILQLDIPEDVWLKGDPVRLKQILGNLVDNAIRSTEKGSVTVHVLTQTHPSANWKNLRIVVTDTGCGLSTELKQHIFDLLKRNQVDQENQTGTFGLGLSICRELVRLMDGHIGVESKEGEGATFWFMLPLPVTTAPLTTASDSHEISGSFNRTRDYSHLRVLVAEDNQVNQMVIIGHLKKLGITPELASDGQQAVTLCAQKTVPFNIIFMDSEMPVMDGKTAARSILANYAKTGADKKVLICSLSAHVFADDLAAARAAGMHECLTKPVRREELQALLDRHIDQYSD